MQQQEEEETGGTVLAREHGLRFIYGFAKAKRTAIHRRSNGENFSEEEVRGGVR